MRTSLPARRRAAAVLLCGLLTTSLVAAAPALAQEASSSPSPTPSPSAAPAPVRVTQADSGRTVTLVPGQELEVELTAPQGEQWQGPLTAGPLYLVEYSEGASSTRARLQALRPGSAQLTARTDRACFHSGEPCPQGFSQWSLDVQVAEGPLPSGRYDCFVTALPSPAQGDVLVTEADNGGRVTVQQGKQVQVALSSCSDHYVLPSSGGPLFRSSASARANGVSTAFFSALQVGTTQVVSATDPACFHMAQPCARPSMRFSIEVEVVPASPPAEPCFVPLSLEPARTTLTATGRVSVLVRGNPHLPVELLAYTRPSTTFRVVRTGTLRADGTLPFELVPPANTRLYVRGTRCADSPHVVLNVATALTLAVERLGPRQYLFSGDSLPARRGGLIVSLYRITSDGREVLTAQARADEQDGTWRVLRTFTGSGRFGFVVRTGQDLQNAPGRSGVRSLLVF